MKRNQKNVKRTIGSFAILYISAMIFGYLNIESLAQKEGMRLLADMEQSVVIAMYTRSHLFPAIQKRVLQYFLIMIILQTETHKITKQTS